jgi:hypothetical protein
MGLISFLEDHAFAGAVLIIGVFLVGSVAYAIFGQGFSQGTILTGDSGCEWSPVTVEETGQTFSTMNELNDYLDRTGESIPEGFETQVRDGLVQQRLTECEVTSIGGEA